MRLLLIIARSDFGGGPRHVDQLIDQLPSDVEIYAAYPPNGEPYGQKWDRCSRIKSRYPLPYRKFSVGTLLKLKKFVIENDIDIIHSHGNGAGVYSRLLKLMGIKSRIVHTFHGVTNNYTSYVKKIANSISGKILRLFTDEFICVSKGEYALALQSKFIVPNRSKVVYNGIENNQTFVQKSKQFNVVTLSRFDYQKNMDMALAIARKLKDENIRFVWVGDGTDFERLKNVAEQERLNIDFVGFSKEPFKYLQAAYIYLSTSRFEGLPYALIEAAQAALPIVATNVVGNNECLDDGKTGYLFDTVEMAAKYILQLKEDPMLYKEMSKQSLTFYENNFTLNKMICELVHVYRSQTM